MYHRLFHCVFVTCLVAVLTVGLGLGVKAQSMDDGQAIAEKIAGFTSKAIYNLDTDQLRAVVETYLAENAAIKVLIITESIDKERLLTYFRKDDKAVFNEPIPEDYLALDSYTSASEFEGEEIGTITIHFASSAAIGLSEEERAWIKNNPVIRVHNETDWPPFNFAEAGKPQGFSIDFMNLLAKKTGLEVEYVTGPTWNEFLDMTKSGDLDIMLNIVKTPERLTYLLYTPPYANNPNTILSRKSEPYNTIESLFGHTIAVPKGFFYEEILKRDFPKITVMTTSGVLESMKAVQFGSADAAFGELAVFSYLLRENFMSDLGVSGEVELRNPEYALLNIATRKDLPELVSILTKGMNFITSEERNVLQNTWLSSGNMSDSHTAVSGLDLTEEEKQWIKDHPEISIVDDFAWPPFTYQDEDGNFAGIASSYFEIFEEKLGIDFQPQFGRSWKQALDDVKSRKGDIVPTLIRTPERETFLAFTEPIISFPVVLASRRNSPFIDGLEALAGKRVGVVNGYLIQERIEQDFPNLQVVAFANVAEGIKGLEDGSVDAFAGNLGVINYEMNRIGVDSVKIAAPTPFVDDLSLGVRKDWPELAQILNKVIDSISDREKAAIKNSWLSITVQIGTQITTILTWAIPITLVAIAIFITIVNWNRRLGWEVKEREKAERLARENESILQTILDNMPAIVFLKDISGHFIRINRRYQELYGPDPNTISGKTVHDIYPSELADKLGALDQSTIDAGGLVENEHTVFDKDHDVILRSHMFPVLDENGKMTAFGGIEVDISARKRAEQKLEDAYQIISSSIDYATNIQHSILPPEKIFRAAFDDYFVVWEPRDRVGGDIYWCRPWGLGYLVICADCTGHGVPGAFMTLIAAAALDRAQEAGIPGRVGQLITRMHQLVQLTLRQNEKSGRSDDGLELGACFIDVEQKQMVFSGARFSLFVSDDEGVTELKGDKSGIGYRGIPLNQSFTDHKLELEPGVQYYLSSDGMIDQIGGERRRMYGKKKFKALLSDIKGSSMTDQKTRILESMADYQGRETRRDDLTVVGFRVR